MKKNILSFTMIVVIAGVLAGMPSHVFAKKGITEFVQSVIGSRKDIQILPSNNPSSLKIEINKHTVKTGDNVEFRFSSQRNGYVSLWDIGTSGKVTRVFPNQYSNSNYVHANQWYGAGGANDRFSFKVNPPTGMEDVYLVWTATSQEQPKEFKYGAAKALAKDLEAVERLPEQNWATAKTTFEIVDDNREAQFTVDPPSTTVNVNNKVYILAMGANVTPLTKTNQDARNFVHTMKAYFKVPENHIQLIENAYKNQFASAMTKLRQQSHSGDLILIFFSGHGSTIADDDHDEKDGVDEGFVMYDAQAATYPSARHFVRDDEFASWVSALPTNKVITFIDACHSGGLRKSFSASRTKFFTGGNLGIFHKGMAMGTHNGIPGVMDENKSGSPKVKGLVFAAAREDQAALETQQGGLFTYCFLKSLGDSGSRDLNQVFNKAKKMVLKTSNRQQEPVNVGERSIADLTQ